MTFKSEFAQGFGRLGSRYLRVRGHVTCSACGAAASRAKWRRKVLEDVRNENAHDTGYKAEDIKCEQTCRQRRIVGSKGENAVGGKVPPSLRGEEGCCFACEMVAPG